VQRLDENTMVTIANPQTASEEGVLSFSLQESDTEKESRFSFSDDGDKFMTILEDGSPAITYIYGMHLAEDIPENRTRACYYHPVYGLDGEVISDDFPSDHHHHRGIFTAWPQVLVNGDTLDLWHIRGIEKRFESWRTREAGPVAAVLDAQVGWYTGDTKVVEETSRVIVYPAGTSGRALDFTITITAVDKAFSFLGAHNERAYGGFCFRPAPREDAEITTANGYLKSDSDLVPAPWGDFSARFGGRPDFSGLTIMGNEDNPGYPNGWTLRYYGFLGIAWPGQSLYTIEADETVTLRYRVWIHRGTAEAGQVTPSFELYEEQQRFIP
jgi:hypothetical protein